MIKFQGQRNGTTLYGVDGFIYERLYTNANRKSEYFRCIRRRFGCPGRGVKYGDKDFVMTSNHTHESDQEDIDIRQMRTVVRKRVAERTGVPHKTIFMEELEKRPHLKDKVSFEQWRKSIRSSIKGCPKAKKAPPDGGLNPDSILGMAVTIDGDVSLSHTGDGQRPFFVKAIELKQSPGAIGIDEEDEVTIESHEAALIFASPDRMREKLSRTNELHIDASYRAVPTPLFKALVTLHMRAYNNLFPVAYVLTSSVTKDAYVDILNAFKNDICPGLAPQMVIGDYDADIQDAVEVVFPEAIYAGTWFHYARSVFLELRSASPELKSNACMQKAVRMLAGLCFLPAHSILDGFQSVQNSLRSSPSSSELQLQMEAFLESFEACWLKTVGAEALSVRGMEDQRTENHLNQFHAVLLLNLSGARSSPWKFLEKLKHVEALFRGDFETALEGKPVAKQRESRCMGRERRTLNAIERFSDNVIDTAQFLQSITTLCTALEGQTKQDPFLAESSDDRHPRRRAMMAPSVPHNPTSDHQYMSNSEVMVLDGSAVTSDPQIVLDGDGNYQVILPNQANFANRCFQLARSNDESTKDIVIRLKLAD